MPEAIQQLFVQQSSDYLTELEPYLLELEVAGEEANSELLGRIFRVMHSIRGGAGLLGLEKIRNLTRMLECVIHLVRNGSLTVTQELVRTILRSCDVLQELITGEDSSRLPQVMATLDGMARGAMAEPELLDTIHFISLPDGRPILHINGYELDRCRTGDVFLYVLEFDLHNDVAAKDITTLGLLEYLQKSGHVLATHCEGDIEDPDCGCAEGHTRLYVLFSTILESDLVNAVFMIDTCHIHQVDVDAVAAGAGSLRADGLISNDACGGLPEAVTDAPIEGVDELMAEYDRTLLKMQEASRVPFEPWEEYDGVEMDLPVHSGSYDAMMNGLPMSYRAAPLARAERGVFDDLAPVDDILDGYAIEGMAVLGEDMTLSDDPVAAGEEYPSLTAMGDGEDADTPGQVSGTFFQEASEGISEEMHDGSVPDWLKADADPAGIGVSDSVAVSPVSPIREPDEKEDGMNDQVGYGSERDSDREQLDALELEFEAALLAEAKAAGIVLPQAGHHDAVDDIGMSGTGPAVFSEADSEADPDADLFMDSGEQPDLSYLTVPERDAGTGGVSLAMDDAVDTVHGFSAVAGMGEVSLQLTGELTIAHAGRIREALLDLAQEYSRIELDMRKTEAMDVTFIQVLLAARKSAQARGVALVVREGVSDAAQQVFRQCGLDASAQERLGLSSLFSK